ncbi:hypothetical protein ACN94_18305 [Gordonia paraffinivorans]|uniref:hypothetical protein n=1 Tax=Gordonia paraffinivorans TaxID=175628 RepID=UPI001C92CDA6|nr:hypothetical protein [Gordonia paraffinivorans]MBY4575513.1 hypothetical protein [Gordonia paraffinivorans]
MATIVPAAADVEREAQMMVDFLARWAPFGAGDEDIYPTFGVDPDTFYERVARHLRADPTLVRPGQNAGELMSYCRRRAGSPPPAVS